MPCERIAIHTDDSIDKFYCSCNCLFGIFLVELTILRDQFPTRVLIYNSFFVSLFAPLRRTSLIDLCGR